MTDDLAIPDGPLFLVGIGGAGMSALAWVLAKQGRVIRGADPGIAPAVKARLESIGVTVYTRHDPGQIGDAACVIATDAVLENHVELVAARERGIPVWRRPKALAAIVNGAETAICVAGTHGKTTTTGMVARVLIEANLNPTVLVGGDFTFLDGGNARAGDPDLVVAESCEAYGGLELLAPTIAVITNIEPDHLDHHGTEEALIGAFATFVGNIRLGGTRILPADDARAKRLWLVEGGLGGVSYTVEDGSAGWMARRITFEAGRGHFDAIHDPDCVGESVARIALQVPGVHNVHNALAALIAAQHVGACGVAIRNGLGAFDGAGRRFEKLGEVDGALIIDDYAHHPTEIRATLSAARAAYPDRRIVAAFQPHLPSRTRDFFDDFAAALADGADRIFLTDIYLAREKPMDGVSSEKLAEAVNGRKPGAAVYAGDLVGVTSALQAELRPGDIALIMGAGDIRKAAEALLG